MTEHTVLVLGAGASLAYGLPLGKGLVEKICELLPSNNQQHMSGTTTTLYNELINNPKFIASWQTLHQTEPYHALIEFRQRLKESNPKSIDAFLSRDFGGANEAFQLIGKLSIAYVISANEAIFKSLEIENSPNTDHWYRYLWQECLNNGCRSFDDIKAKKLRIVSFNYDRSFEYFLGRRLAATYFAPPGTLFGEDLVESWAKPGFEAVETDFEITHPYGTLGLLTKIPYGGQKNHHIHGMSMASNIQVIDEDRKDNTSFDKACNWLASARRVVFLGFSFDPLNMDRLGLAKGLPMYMEKYQQPPHRRVFPMTYGLAQAERNSLITDYFEQFLGTESSDAMYERDSHQTMPITQYLRHYGGLTGL